MSEPIPTDPVVDPDFPPEDPVPPEQEPVEPGPETPVVDGWLDAAAQAEADAKQYTDEQVPLVAGRMVPRNMDRPPTVEDGADLIAGTGWNQYDPVTNDLVQMWRWDGAAWQALDMSAEMIPVLDIGSATVGDLTGDRINVTGTLSANIVDAMDVATKKLVVTEEAILNHATLIGDTVVDNINVTGKLIGTDGVFTGTVDFENVNVTGLQLVEKLEANSISADKIEGGAFTGESFTGGSFVGGEFRTSDTLPGRVTLADDAYINSDSGVAHPGIRVEPLDTSAMARPPGIGPGDRGLYVDGGSDTSGRRSYLRTSPTASLMRTSREGGTDGGVIQTSPTSSLMRTYREDGTIGASIQADPDASRMRTYSGNSSEQGWVQAQPREAELAYVAPNNVYFSRIRATDKEAHLFTRAGGSNRYLTVDADGIWVKTNKGGSWKQYNLEETAQDSGWNNFSVSSGLTLNEQTAWRNKGGIIWLAGRVRADWAVGEWTSIATLPAAIRPSRNIRASAPIDGRPTHLLEINTEGALRLYRPPNDAGGPWSVQISTLVWPTG